MENIINENTLCIRCGHQLQIAKEPMDMCDEIESHQYECPHCGAYHTITMVPDEEKENYPYYSSDNNEDSIPDCNHGYPGYCFQCGTHVIWSSDFMRSEIWGDVPTDENGNAILEKDSLATYVTCPHCGATIEIVDVPYDKELNYPYYQERYASPSSDSEEANEDA